MANTSPEKERQMLGLFLVPGVYLRVMADTVRQMGHNDRALYEGLAFGPDDLKANDSRIFVTDAIVMAQRAQEMAADQGLSFMLARELRVTIHGTWAWRHDQPDPGRCPELGSALPATAGTLPEHEPDRYR